MAAAAAASRGVAVGDDDGTKEAKDLTTEQWLAKFAAVKLKPDGKTPEFGEITRVANMYPAVSKSTFNHRWNTKDSRETAFGPAPALGVLEADIIQWIRDYRALGVKLPEIAIVHKALHVAKKAGIAWDFRASRSWLAGFSERSGIKWRLGQWMETERSHAVSEESLNRFYDVFSIASEGVLPKNLCAKGLGPRRQQVVGRRKRRSPATRPCPLWHLSCGPSSL